MATKLSATDRKQLCKITEGRFEMLHEELHSRKTKIEKIIEGEVIKSHEKDILKIQEGLKGLVDEENTANQEHKKTIEKIKIKKDNLIKKAKEIGLVVDKPGYGEVIPTIKPLNLRQLLEKKQIKYILNIQMQKRI